MRRAAIGIFDSGIGGLTVAAEVVRQLPCEDIVYLGDTARLPYGTKSASTVCRYAERATELLLRYPIKAVVVACNTASAHALPTLRAMTEMPVLGVVENMSYFSPPGSDERYEIFGKGGGAEIEREFGVPMLQALPIDPSVRAGGDDGQPVVWSHPDSSIAESFHSLAGQVAARVSTLNAS